MPDSLLEKDIFKIAMKFVLDAEGGYTNDPDDPGGETNFGIDKRSHPNVDIKKLTTESATDIYYNDYWLPSSAKHLKPMTAISYFDSCVNTGRRQANLFLQRALGVKADGDVGPITLQAATASVDKETAFNLIEQRQKFYQGLADTRPRLAKFLKGWTNRNNNLKDYLAKNIA